MEIDIYCKNRKCPICESNIVVSDFYKFDSVCVNKCYEIYRSDISNGYAVSIFYDEDNEEETYFSTKTQKKKIIDKINYWKENDKYLMRIIVGE
ncbi:MAG: hypothetical protein K0R18_495 [Bacillales bacterium]|jgi:transcription initiation factor TFIIIB Brf1 subunit/transcription initiation factor TFIIB|nr:hypothetical protein [Bacillales bacterium]